MTIETKIKKDGGSVALYNSVEKVITEAGRSNLSIKKVAYQRGQSKFKLIEAYSFTDGRKSPVAGSSIKTANLKSA